MKPLPGKFSPGALVNVTPGHSSFANNTLNVFDKSSRNILNGLNQVSTNRSQLTTEHTPEMSTMLINHAGEGKPNIIVDELTKDDGIKYRGTFDSMTRDTRITLFQALITPDEFRYPLMLEL